LKKNTSVFIFNILCLGGSEQGQGDQVPASRASRRRSAASPKPADNTQTSMKPHDIQTIHDTFQSPRHKSNASTKSKATSGSEGSKGAARRAGEGARSATGSPSYLEIPPTDTRPDRLVLNTEEEMLDLRKRDREGLKGYNAKVRYLGVQLNSWYHDLSD